MEIALLLVFLTLFDDDAAREKLRSFLGFYRENRELFAALAETPRPAPAAQAEGQKKSPPVGADSGLFERALGAL